MERLLLFPMWLRELVRATSPLPTIASLFFKKARRLRDSHYILCLLLLSQRSRSAAPWGGAANAGYPPLCCAVVPYPKGSRKWRELRECSPSIGHKPPATQPSLLSLERGLLAPSPKGSCKPRGVAYLPRPACRSAHHPYRASGARHPAVACCSLSTRPPVGLQPHGDGSKAGSGSWFALLPTGVR